MGYEEFMWAIGNNTYDLLRETYKSPLTVGDSLNNKQCMILKYIWQLEE